MKTATFIPLVLLQLVFAFLSSSAGGIEKDFIAKLHANPPPPCIAKRTDDKSSGIAMFPDGNRDEQLRGILGRLAAMFLSKGAALMAPSNTKTVYTAVFYQEKPINEIGVYGYEFAIPLDSSMFKAHGELNGKVFVLDNHTLILLWHESLERTAECFQVLGNILEAAQ